MSEELKACPFCGEKAEVTVTKSGMGYLVYCDNCDGWEKEEMEAIEKLGVDVINIKLQGEKTKKYSSGDIIKKYNKN